MNEIRGEAEVQIGDQSFTLVLTMETLALVSRAHNGVTMGEALQRLVGGEPNAIAAVLKAKGNESLSAAVKTLADFMTVASGCQQAIDAMLGPDEGNAEGGAAGRKA